MPKLVLKNYRCFEDTHPAEIDLSPGFTAFVGPFVTDPVPVRSILSEGIETVRTIGHPPRGPPA